jgi:hypothetical protein
MDSGIVFGQTQLVLVFIFFVFLCFFLKIFIFFIFLNFFDMLILKITFKK